ncbi:hypothetical protein SL003B_3861 [Polymorphum gilvum SL003B-26A1]|uniref:Uncharacterized protein n=1 Tax=Polymorphum gilvum (strain LMG 25793 / CGMCC 1.9160 / SL003B-26A1) TaxID=991905 RepID=F2J4M9_POLGS|nr:hypothetical protein SL003B_3861 [Polymorphum gilvum SL003B-26A1]
MPSPPEAVLAPLHAAIARAQAVVEAETEALRRRAGIDLKSFEYRKSQALLDLDRARRSLPSEGLDRRTSEQLGMLRMRLDENMALLSTHMSAVREIADVIAKAMLEADSDGTYSRPGSGCLP